MSRLDDFLKLRDELEFEDSKGKTAYFMIDGLLNCEDMYAMSREDALKMAQWIIISVAAGKI